MTDLKTLVEDLGLARFGNQHHAVRAARAAILTMTNLDRGIDADPPTSCYEAGLSAVRNMTGSDGQFERGIACGLAMLLRMERNTARA